MEAARDLSIGAWRLRFEGLDAGLARVLDARWGGFVAPSGERLPTARVLIRTTSEDLWLPAAAPGEGYRIEATLGGGQVLVRSYAFALEASGAGAWTLALAQVASEPRGRTMDNAARWLVARLAAQDGGVALHGAGVAASGNAWVFAGPSRSGKSTAARMMDPAAPLGDDFAVIVPSKGGWGVPAVPFDNSESAPPDPVRGVVPLGGVLRVFQANKTRIERPASPLAEASLLACAAFPWALPDHRDAIEAAIDRLIASGKFAHLHFTLDTPLAGFLEGPL